MKFKQQNYFGTVVRSMEMENFCISLNSHTPDTEVHLHSHEKPYLCLVVDGMYRETNCKTSTIFETGTSLFRGANYKHANQFYNQGGTFLNVEINDPEDFMEENDFRLPNNEIPRLGTIDIYKLLYSFKNDLPDDLLNILCYESMIMHFDMFPVRGKLDWVRKVKERFHDDPFSSISLTYLSKEFDLHPNYIVRKFKDVTGYRLSEYLNKTRVELSLSKMIQTDDNLTKIAFDSGFCDQSHFNRNFKRHIATSPKKFRNTLKG